MALPVGLVDVARLILIFLMAVGGLTPVCRADFAKDLARIHTEAVGGRGKVESLKAFRATGTTRNEQGDLRFILWAARPNRVRTEITSGARTVVQAWNGKNEPWRADSHTRKVTFMLGDSAAEFKAEAEFDDPLVVGGAGNVSLDYAGEVTLEGRELLKVLVTQNLTELSFVYLDPVSFLIVRRDVIRRRRGRDEVVRTDYSDFRPVAGVLLAHRMVVFKNGRQVNETIIDRMEPNPAWEESLFSLAASTGK
jgi:hypothetical protein